MPTQKPWTEDGPECPCCNSTISPALFARWLLSKLTMPPAEASRRNGALSEGRPKKTEIAYYLVTTEPKRVLAQAITLRKARQVSKELRQAGVEPVHILRLADGKIMSHR